MQARDAAARAGPNTLVGLAKPADAEAPFKRAEAVAALVPAYEAVLKELAGLGVPEVQLHEPILTHSDAASLKSDFEASYKALSAVGVPINLVRRRVFLPRWVAAPVLWPGSASCESQWAGCLLCVYATVGCHLADCPHTLPDASRALQQFERASHLMHALWRRQVTYYDDIGEAYTWAVELPVAALSLDFLGVPGSVLGSDTAALIEKHGFPDNKRLGAGVVDGRSVWADGQSAPNLIGALIGKARPRPMSMASCLLLAGL